MTTKKSVTDVQPLCSVSPPPARVMPAGLDADRMRALIVGGQMWVNGTVLHYYFFDRDSDASEVRFPDGSVEVVSWVGPPAQQDAVRAAFQTWKDLGIGLEFREVHDRTEAEVRIGFQLGGGSKSAVGRRILGVATNQRTTNYGWDLTTPYGRSTALHELGHVLGMAHEHQSPYAGIVWDEPEVYRVLAGPPNFWDAETTLYNVLRKLTTAEVQGSRWDPYSIMEYAFPAGLITEPAQYHDGLTPPGTISDQDAGFVRQWYPALAPAPPPTLTPFESVALELAPGEQADFTLTPPASRTYQIATFGASDVVLVLFEDIDGELRHVAGDDDGGEERNVRIEARLFQGRRYVIRLRLYHARESGLTAIMYW